jgi:hypothetical protein
MIERTFNDELTGFVHRGRGRRQNEINSKRNLGQ